MSVLVHTCACHCRRSAKRRREAELKATKTLGASGDDVDDLAAWAARVNTSAAADGASAAAAGTGRSGKRQKKAAAAAGSGDEGDGYTAADLAGMKVRHDLENLTEGEAVVLTLADTGGLVGGSSSSRFVLAATNVAVAATLVVRTSHTVQSQWATVLTTTFKCCSDGGASDFWRAW